MRGFAGRNLDRGMEAKGTQERGGEGGRDKDGKAARQWNSHAKKDEAL